MSRASTRAAALLFALVFAVAPTMVDRCAEVCAAHPTSAASTPSCHHTTTAAPRVGHVPLPCGQDHQGTAIAAAKNIAAAPLIALIVDTDSGSACLFGDDVGSPLRDLSPPASISTLHSQSLPLRI